MIKYSQAFSGHNRKQVLAPLVNVIITAYVVFETGPRLKKNFYVPSISILRCNYVLSCHSSHDGKKNQGWETENMTKED